MKRILIACEESQAVCIEFRKLWFEAYSCDIQECSWWHPERHLQWDVLNYLNQEWDLIIAHPPCTYLSNAWARRLYAWWELNKDRYNKWLEAKDFFMKFYNHKCKHIVIENPLPSKIYNLPKYSQIIQPYEYWHPYSKKTLLWIKWLPNLKPTNVVWDIVPFLPSNTWWKKRGQKATKWIVNNAKDASKTFSWIAKAMAEQWWKIIN